jgi:hypothetical protein
VGAGLVQLGWGGEIDCVDFETAFAATSVSGFAALSYEYSAFMYNTNTGKRFSATMEGDLDTAFFSSEFGVLFGTSAEFEMTLDVQLAVQGAYLCVVKSMDMIPISKYMTPQPANVSVSTALLDGFTDRVVVSWTVDVSASSGIVEFDIFTDRNIQGSFLEITQTQVDGSLREAVVDVVAGHEYQFRVRSKNSLFGGEVATSTIQLPCPSGNSGSGNSGCSPCPVGTYSSANETLVVCVTCGVNTVSTGGANACDTCTDHTIANAGQSACVPCHSGHHREEGSSVCSLCPGNQVSYGDGEGCEECPEGSLANEEKSTCILCKSCPEGSRVVVECSGHGRNDRSCEFCTQGSYQDQPNQGACLDCPPGFFCPDAATRKSTCQKGTYCRGNSTLPSVVQAGYMQVGEQGDYVALHAHGEVPCPAGSYCKSGEQFECESGDYCPAASSSRTVCAQGHFCSTPSVLAACSDGSFCPEGSLSPQDCPKGFFCSTPVSKSACQRGTFCGGNATLPTTVQAGYMQVDERGLYTVAYAFAEKQCPSGSHCKNGEPAWCESGDYCPAGSAARTVCPAGSFCPIPSQLTSCWSGSFCPEGSLEESQCPAGFFCTEPASKLPCAMGSYQPNEGSNFCFPCESGKYQDEEGATECKACRPGFFCTEGSPLETSCPMGTYCAAQSALPPSLSNGYYAVTSSGEYTAAGGVEEVICPAGWYCSGGNKELCTTQGSYCPMGSSREATCAMGHHCPRSEEQLICDAGYFCTVGNATKCLPGNVCPIGSSRALPCPKGSYCDEDATQQIECESGSYCPEGTFGEPQHCAEGAICTNPAWPELIFDPATLEIRESDLARDGWIFAFNVRLSAAPVHGTRVTVQVEKGDTVQVTDCIAYEDGLTLLQNELVFDRLNYNFSQTVLVNVNRNESNGLNEPLYQGLMLPFSLVPPPSPPLTPPSFLLSLLRFGKSFFCPRCYLG